MKIREIIKLIEKDGWYIVATKGSHRQYKHLTKTGSVTIAGHPADELAQVKHPDRLKDVASNNCRSSGR